MNEHDPGYPQYLQTLKAELTNDPTNVGYAGKTDAECAAAINTVGLKPAWTKARVTPLVRTGEILACIDAGELAAFIALGAVKIGAFQALCACVEVNAMDTQVRQYVLNIFAPAGTFPLTRAALTALVDNEPAARWEMIQDGTPVGAHDVARARAL